MAQYGELSLTCSNAEKVLVVSRIHLDVSGAHEVLVSGKRELSVLRALELYQRLTVAPTLSAQTEPDATSACVMKTVACRLKVNS